MYTHISEDICFTADPHVVVERPDFSGLETLYQGRTVCFGEFQLPFRLALPVQDRKFYRAVVIRCADGVPAAIGNPIWLDKE